MSPTLKILILEDNPADAERVARELSHAGGIQASWGA
jgi:hypothetical protein